MVVEAEDPITDTTYDLGDPVDLLMTMAVVIVGLSMTLIALGLASRQVVPFIESLISGLLGIDTESGGPAFSIDTAGAGA